MKEIWKNLIYNNINYGDFYEISNHGNIRNSRTKYIVKQTINHDGYLTYCGSLGSRNKKKLFRTNRAVGCTFIDNPDNKPEVNHKDTNKLNNVISNLEWATGKENVSHAIKNGLYNNSINEGNRKPVICIETNQIYESVTNAAKITKLFAFRIRESCKNNKKTCGNYHWKFYNAR